MAACRCWLCLLFLLYMILYTVRLCQSIPFLGLSTYPFLAFLKIVGTWFFLGFGYARCSGPGCSGLPGSGTEPIHRGPPHELSALPGGRMPLLTAWNRGRYPGTLRAAGFFCISLGAHRAAVNTLSEPGFPISLSVFQRKPSALPGRHK